MGPRWSGDGNRPLTTAKRRSAWVRFAPGILGFGAVVAAGLGWSLIRFGSLTDAWRYAGGERIFFDRPMIELDAGKPGEERAAEFRVRNLSDAPVQILGVQTSCNCVAPDVLPATVPPRGSLSLRLRLHLDPTPTGLVEQTAMYHTDEPTAPEMTALVRCRVVTP